MSDEAIGRLSASLRHAASFAKVTRSTAPAERHVVLDTQAHADDAPMYLQPYGLQSAPLEGAVAVLVAPCGRADEVVAVCVADRRYNIALEAGDVAVIDYRGQRVLLGPDGVVVEGSVIKLGAGAMLAAARETDPVALAADFGTWATDVAAKLSGLGAPLAAPLPAGTGTITAGSAKTVIE